MKKKQRKSKYIANYDFFKTWSCDMAYILGLWFADGHICKGRSHIFGITLDRKDSYLLRSILSKMGSTHRLYLNRNVYSMCICSKEIVADIINLGGTLRKSLVVKFPLVPRKYLSSFIRGYFDGDGSVYKLKYRKGYSSNFSSSSKSFILSLKEKLEANIQNFKCSLSEKLPYTSFSKDKSIIITSKNKSYCLAISSNNTRRLRDFMYNDGSTLKMIRKYQKHMLNGEINLSVSDRNFMPYQEAIRISMFLKLKTKREWHRYFKEHKLEMNGIPSHPEIIYKREWNGWDCWIGKTRKVS